MIVYTPLRTRLGDCIHAASNAIAFAKKHNKKINFAPHEKIMSIDDIFKRRFVFDTFTCALQLFNYENYLNIVSVTTPGKRVRFHHAKQNFDECRYQWSAKNTSHNKICYAFNSRSGANKFKTEKDKEDLAKLLNHLECKYITFDCHEFGLVNSFETTIKEMLASNFFIGTCSGWSHVALALNMPVELIQMKLPLNKINSWYELFNCKMHTNIDAIIKAV
jgi:hypothetical protein